MHWKLRQQEKLGYCLSGKIWSLYVKICGFKLLLSYTNREEMWKRQVHLLH